MKSQPHLAYEFKFLFDFKTLMLVTNMNNLRDKLLSPTYIYKLIDHLLSFRNVLDFGKRFREYVLVDTT